MTQQMVIRAARLADVKAVARCWHTTYFQQQGVEDSIPQELLRQRTLEAFERRSAARLEKTVVGELGDDVCGFSVALPDEGEVEQLFVDARARGTGLAGRLLAAAEERLPGPAMHLVVTPKNVRAIKFYEKHGWCNAGRVVYDAEVGDGKTFPLDLVRFEKRREV